MIYLVDASVYVFRAYYSLPDSMTNDNGDPINAAYGFARFLGDLIEATKAEHIAVAFDESLTDSYRNEIYPEYKANREPAPPDLKKQFKWCREISDALGLPGFSSNRYEADDIIGTITVRMRDLDHMTTIVTRDKDLAQLLKPGDVFWDYASNRRLGYDDIEGNFGVQPEKIADFLALAGDPVDNIPGVPGVGKKTAAALMMHFESLDDLYDNLDQVASLSIRGAKTLGDKLDGHRDAAYLAQKLTRIECDMDLDIGESTISRSAPDEDLLNDVYDRVGFGTALRRQAERIAELHR